MRAVLTIATVVIAFMLGNSLGQAANAPEPRVVTKTVEVEVPVERIVEREVKVDKIIEVVRLPPQCDNVFSALPRALDAGSELSLGKTNQQKVMSDAGLAIMNKDWEKLRDLQVVQDDIKKSMSGAYIEMAEAMMAYENNIDKCKGASK